jgi:hypothetical protein
MATTNLSLPQPVVGDTVDVAAHITTAFGVIDDLMDGDVTPAALGTASAGSNVTEASRADHVHSSASLALTSPVLTTPQLQDTSANHQYITAVSELAADRTVTMPLLGAADEFVFKDHAVTMTNKTLTSAVLNTGVSGTAVLDEDDMSTDSATQLATQQSIKAYVDTGGVSQSNQAALEGETNENSYAPPDLLKHTPGFAKFYVKFDASATVQGTAYNTTSVADDGTGSWTVTIGTDFSGIDWSCSVTIETTWTRSSNIENNGQAAGTLQVRSTDNNGNLSDGGDMHVIGFGDQ